MKIIWGCLGDVTIFSCHGNCLGFTY